jgi:hypothetical protein
MPVEHGRPVLGAAAFIAIVAFSGYLAVGFAGALFSVAFVGGFVVWLLTTHRTPIDPHPVLVPYLMTVIAFLVHVYEEYVAHVERHLAALSGLPVTQADFLVIAAFVAPTIWLVGAVMMLKRWAFGWFLGSTFLFGMMFAELSHFVSPFVQDGSTYYSPGMYTAILPIASGWWTFTQILHQMKLQRTQQGPRTVVARHRSVG